MITVHHFKVLNSKTGEWEISDCMRTAEAIAELNGRVMVESEQMVFQGMLDLQGRYFPPDYGKDGEQTPAGVEIKKES